MMVGNLGYRDVEEGCGGWWVVVPGGGEKDEEKKSQVGWFFVGSFLGFGLCEKLSVKKPRPTDLNGGATSQPHFLRIDQLHGAGWNPLTLQTLGHPAVDGWKPISFGRRCMQWDYLLFGWRFPSRIPQPCAATQGVKISCVCQAVQHEQPP
ncbi:hypothetical protein K440DRAFT_380915 [Wilcoxina mikolae CBS 423.85]|nr:hypothetical protein K440DRAFT_380915 [Wilcoxina mikolae CBS 423.85]